MKKSPMKMLWILAGLLLAGFFPALTHAQAETGAQEHEATNMAANTPAPTKTDFAGTLLTAVQRAMPRPQIGAGRVHAVGQDSWRRQDGDTSARRK